MFDVVGVCRCYMVAWQAPINWGSSSFSLGGWLHVVPRLDVAILAMKPEVMTLSPSQFFCW